MPTTESKTKEPEFTDKEIDEILKLQAIIDSPASSKMQKQIAEATLEDLARSKEPPPHGHQSRTKRLSEEREEYPGSGNIARKDEAFEKYEMGKDPQAQHKSMQEHHAVGDLHSVEHNHKARGTAKIKKQHSFHEELP